MRNLLITSISLCLVIASNNLFADNQAKSLGAQSNQNTTITKTTIKKAKNRFFCPPISALKKDPLQLTWSAKGGWKSYSTSFVTKVTQFWGAQWNGTNVGQITCIYHGMPKTSFPVLLVFHTLAHEPKTGNKESNWSKNLGGYRNCASKNPKKCPFKVQLKSKEKNIYQEAEDLKLNSNSSDQQN